MIVLISLYQYENYATRMLYSHLTSHGLPVSYIGFKRQKMKKVKTLKNELIEIYDYCEEPTGEDIDCLIAQLTELDPKLIGINVKSAHFNCAKTITTAIGSRRCPAASTRGVIVGEQPNATACPASRAARATAASGSK